MTSAVTTDFASAVLRPATVMGGKPSKGTPPDRRLSTNKPAAPKKPSK